MNSLKIDEMSREEFLKISTLLLKNMIKENSNKIVEKWTDLKKTNQMYRELRNIEESTGISPQTMSNFGAIIFETYAPEIFGKPEKQMTDIEIGKISLDILLWFIERNGLEINPKNQARRGLGNIACAIGIELDRLMIFSNLFTKKAIDVLYPLPNRST